MPMIPLPRHTLLRPDGRHVLVYETATALFINDTLPEASAAHLAAVPVVPREEHEPFVVEPVV